MPQQSPSKRPHEFAWSMDARHLDLEIIDEEGGPLLKHCKLIAVLDKLTGYVIKMRLEPSQVEDPDSPQ